MAEPTYHETNRYLSQFIATMLSLGHKPEHVRTTLQEWLGIPAAGLQPTVTKHGVTMPAAVWDRIKDGIPADYTEEEFRTYSAIQIARERAARACDPAKQWFPGVDRLVCNWPECGCAAKPQVKK